MSNKRLSVCTFKETNESHYNKFIKVKDNILMNMTAKCGNTSIGYAGVQYNGDSLLSDEEYLNNKDKYEFNHITIATKSDDSWEKINSYLININDFTNISENIVIVYRDPIDRFLSAFKTICSSSGCSLSEAIKGYCNYIQNIIISDKYDNSKLNYHIQPQTNFYKNLSIDQVSLFVPVDKLQDYFKSIDLTIPIFNSAHLYERQLKKIFANQLDLSILKSFYKSDYEFFAQIPEEKLFK